MDFQAVFYSCQLVILDNIHGVWLWRAVHAVSPSIILFSKVSVYSDPFGASTSIAGVSSFLIVIVLDPKLDVRGETT